MSAFPLPARRYRRISAPALRRHAPAGHDRHRAVLRAQAADRRRADDGARCHHPSPDHRPAAQARASSSGTALLFITHDLGVVAEACTRIITMYAGEVVEDAPVDDVLTHPQHPYTSGLLRSIPRLSQREDAAAGDPRPRAAPADMPARLPLCAALHVRAAAMRQRRRRCCGVITPTSAPAAAAMPNSPAGASHERAWPQLVAICACTSPRAGMARETVKAVDGVTLRRDARRDFRHHRRIGLGQIDAWAARSSAC